MYSENMCVFYCYCIVFLDDSDLDVLPQGAIDEDDIIGSLHWEDLAHASNGIYYLYNIFIVF